MKPRSIDDIKKLIRQLQKITIENGAAEGEVYAAAQVIQKLLIKHHLELNDIDDEEVKNREAIKKEIWRTGRLMWYDETLIAIMHDYYLVSIYKTRDYETKETLIIAVGFEEDIETFKSIMLFCNNIMKKMFTVKSKQNKNLIRNDFYDGFCKGIRQALEDNKKGMESEYSTALVPVKDAIEKIMPKLSHKKKSGIKPNFNGDINSFAEGYSEGQNAYKEFGGNGYAKLS
jgi:hypothetical protein